MTTIKKLSIFLLCVLLAIPYTGCSDTGKKVENLTENPSVSDSATESETKPAGAGSYEHGLKYDFNGQQFNILAFDNANVHTYTISNEENGDLFNDALYKYSNKIEEDFNIIFNELHLGEPVEPFKKSVLAGDKAFDIANIRCSDALPFYKDGMTISASKIPNIDLTQPWWNQKMNNSLTVGGETYIAMGSYNISTFDLSYCMLFNKDMMKNYSLGDIYTFVDEGSWTIDKMSEMMLAVASDIDSDGAMTIENDIWGYVANPKQVLPNFWIAGGEFAIGKDENDMPYIAMGNERFVSLIEKVYSVLLDNPVAFFKSKDVTDVPKECVDAFTSNHSLFIDMAYFHIERMRSAEVDFGIIPYPKYDSEQSEYYGRTSYYIPTVVPMTNSKLEMTGAVLEALNCEAANTVIPTYFDIMLKTKYSRDEQSVEMLDLLFKNSVIDIGDTTLCDIIRDGFIRTMFIAEKRELVSQVEKNTAKINKRLADIVSK